MADRRGQSCVSSTCGFRWPRRLDWKFGEVFFFLDFVFSHLTVFDTSENNMSEPSACQWIIIIVGGGAPFGNTIQIPTVHSSVVYESVDSQVKQPLPQNTTGIPADRKRMMNPVSARLGFALTGTLSSLFKFQSRGSRYRHHGGSAEE